MQCSIIKHCVSAYSKRNLQSHPFLMLQNFETHSCQWYSVKQIKSIFADEENRGTTFRGTSSLSHQVVLISSIKLISSSISLRLIENH